MADEGMGFVAVHVGAGYHSPANSELYKQVCRQACIQAVNLLKQNKNALEATQAAIMSLEDSPYTNAGTGSNLTVQGTVECDGSIMDGESLHYGAVGAISGVKNPICVAQSLLETQMAGNMSLGRIPPSTMVGDGARDWALRKGLQIVGKDTLMTETSRKAFVKHKRKLDMLEDGYENSSNQKARRLDFTDAKAGANGTDGTCDERDESDTSCLLDTVGAVCVDGTGRVVGAVSSGGIVLKQPGRLGQAALYGCGCWAENDAEAHIGVGVSTSGCGEHLTKTLLAKECADCLKAQVDPTSALSNVFKQKFLESPFLRGIQQKLGGALAMRADKSADNMLEVEVLWAHTTDSMCLAYMSTADIAPKALISRLPEGRTCGQSYVVQSKCYTLATTT